MLDNSLASMGSMDADDTAAKKVKLHQKTTQIILESLSKSVETILHSRLIHPEHGSGARSALTHSSSSGSSRPEEISGGHSATPTSEEKTRHSASRAGGALGASGARTTSGTGREKRARPKFNFDLPELPDVRGAMRTWRMDVHAPLTLEILWMDDTALLPPRGEAESGSSGAPIARSEPRPVLIERWLLHYEPATSNKPARSFDHLHMLRQLYKEVAIMLRMLFSTLRVLPSHSLFQREQERATSILSAEAGMESSGRTASSTLATFPQRLRYRMLVSHPDRPATRVSSFSSAVPTAELVLPRIATPYGRLRVGVTYREGVRFREAPRPAALLSATIIADYVPGGDARSSGAVGTAGGEAAAKAEEDRRAEAAATIRSGKSGGSAAANILANALLASPPPAVLAAEARKAQRGSLSSDTTAHDAATTHSHATPSPPSAPSPASLDGSTKERSSSGGVVSMFTEMFFGNPSKERTEEAAAEQRRARRRSSDLQSVIAPAVFGSAAAASMSSSRTSRGRGRTSPSAQGSGGDEQPRSGSSRRASQPIAISGGAGAVSSYRRRRSTGAIISGSAPAAGVVSRTVAASSPSHSPGSLAESPGTTGIASSGSRPRGAVTLTAAVLPHRSPADAGVEPHARDSAGAGNLPRERPEPQSGARPHSFGEFEDPLMMQRVQRGAVPPAAARYSPPVLPSGTRGRVHSIPDFATPSPGSSFSPPAASGVAQALTDRYETSSSGKSPTLTRFEGRGAPTGTPPPYTPPIGGARPLISGHAGSGGSGRRLSPGLGGGVHAAADLEPSSFDSEHGDIGDDPTAKGMPQSSGRPPRPQTSAEYAGRVRIPSAEKVDGIPVSLAQRGPSPDDAGGWIGVSGSDSPFEGSAPSSGDWSSVWGGLGFGGQRTPSPDDPRWSSGLGGGVVAGDVDAALSSDSPIDEVSPFAAATGIGLHGRGFARSHTLSLDDESLATAHGGSAAVHGGSTSRRHQSSTGSSSMSTTRTVGVPPLRPRPVGLTTPPFAALPSPTSNARVVPPPSSTHNTGQDTGNSTLSASETSVTSLSGEGAFALGRSALAPSVAASSPPITVYKAHLTNTPPSTTDVDIVRRAAASAGVRPAQGTRLALRGAPGQRSHGVAMLQPPSPLAAAGAVHMGVPLLSLGEAALGPTSTARTAVIGSSTQSGTTHTAVGTPAAMGYVPTSQSGLVHAPLPMPPLGTAGRGPTPERVIPAVESAQVRPKPHEQPPASRYPMNGAVAGLDAAAVLPRLLEADEEVASASEADDEEEDESDVDAGSMVSQPPNISDPPRSPAVQVGSGDSRRSDAAALGSPPARRNPRDSGESPPSMLPGQSIPESPHSSVGGERGAFTPTRGAAAGGLVAQHQIDSRDGAPSVEFTRAPDSSPVVAIRYASSSSDSPSKRQAVYYVDPEFPFALPVRRPASLRVQGGGGCEDDGALEVVIGALIRQCAEAPRLSVSDALEHQRAAQEARAEAVSDPLEGNTGHSAAVQKAVSGDAGTATGSPTSTSSSSCDDDKQRRASISDDVMFDMDMDEVAGPVSGGAGSASPPTTDRKQQPPVSERCASCRRQSNTSAERARRASRSRNVLATPRSLSDQLRELKDSQALLLRRGGSRRDEATNGLGLDDMAPAALVRTRTA